MWPLVKAWFQFTRSERIGVMVLVVVIIVIFMLPRFFPDRPVELSVEELSYISKVEERRQVTRKDSMLGDGYASERPAAGFYFDPNTLSEDGWKRLGLREKTVGTILKFRERGGRFEVPGDLGKVYGLRQHELDRLLPFVRITQIESGREPTNRSANRSQVGDDRAPVSRARAPDIIIDVNKADSAAWESLPGIGAVLASRIVRWRDRLGGFYSVEQLRETYGVTDTLLKNIRRKLKLGPGTHHTMDINQASLEQLKSHPYIKWKLASQIVNFRLQHGAYKSVEDIRSIGGVNDSVFNKIKQYLTAGPG